MGGGDPKATDVSPNEGENNLVNSFPIVFLLIRPKNDSAIATEERALLLYLRLYVSFTHTLLLNKGGGS